MKESFYRLPGPRPLRLALVADLHGQAPDAVLASLRRRKPDLICVAGDFVHGVPPHAGLKLDPTFCASSALPPPSRPALSPWATTNGC